MDKDMAELGAYGQCVALLHDTRDIEQARRAQQWCEAISVSTDDRMRAWRFARMAGVFAGFAMALTMRAPLTVERRRCDDSLIDSGVP